MIELAKAAAPMREAAARQRAEEEHKKAVETARQAEKEREEKRRAVEKAEQTRLFFQEADAQRGAQSSTRFDEFENENQTPLISGSAAPPPLPASVNASMNGNLRQANSSPSSRSDSSGSVFSLALVGFFMLAGLFAVFKPSSKPSSNPSSYETTEMRQRRLINEIERDVETSIREKLRERGADFSLRNISWDYTPTRDSDGAVYHGKATFSDGDKADVILTVRHYSGSDTKIPYSYRMDSFTQNSN